MWIARRFARRDSVTFQRAEEDKRGREMSKQSREQLHFFRDFQQGRRTIPFSEKNTIVVRYFPSFRIARRYQTFVFATIQSSASGGTESEKAAEIDCVPATFIPSESRDPVAKALR